MTTIRRPSRTVKPTHTPAATWPAWTDADRWVPAIDPPHAPDADDAAWHAANSPTRDDDYEVLAPGPAPVRGGSPDPEESDLDAWLDEACPEPEPECLASGAWGYSLD